MFYSMSVSGDKSTAAKQLRDRADAEKSQLGSANQESADLDGQVDKVSKIIDDHAADGDSVSVSISGGISRSDRGVGISQSFGVTINKATVADPMNPHATPAALEEAKRLAETPSNPTAAGTTQAGTTGVATNAAPSRRAGE